LPACTNSSVTRSRWANSPALAALTRVAGLGRGVASAAMALVPVIAFVGFLQPNGPLRGTRSPDPLPLPDANAGGLGFFAGSVTEVDFVRLNFRAPNEDRTTAAGTTFLEHAPAAIRALDGETVRITGFMIPVDLADGRVRRCVLVPSQAFCCYGAAPRFCEFIVATIVEGDVPATLDVPLTFTGTLHVGDQPAQDGWSAFYMLDVTAVER